MALISITHQFLNYVRIEEDKEEHKSNWPQKGQCPFGILVHLPSSPPKFWGASLFAKYLGNGDGLLGMAMDRIRIEYLKIQIQSNS